MSKEWLENKVADAGKNRYSWTLYFFKIDRRSRNPYIVHKIRFRKGDTLQAYAEKLMEMVGKYQIGKIELVQPYTGENSQVACDKISLESPFIREGWEYLLHDIAEAGDRKISGKYNGYILTGAPAREGEASITLIKMANPVIEMQKQKSIAFGFTGKGELDMMADDICRLYMDTDMIIIGDWLYSFNLKVELLFNMEKTMNKIRDQSIERMKETGALADGEAFLRFAKSYPSSRTFITLNGERMQRLKDGKKRREIAKILALKTDRQGRICVADKEEASLLIRYICFKIFKDFETEGLLEGNNITKVKR